MKKKNIGFILFGVAGANLIPTIIEYIVFPMMYERFGIPPFRLDIILRITLIFSIISASILICVGVILLIKFRNE